MLLRRFSGWAYIIAVVGTGIMMAARAVTQGRPSEILFGSLAFMFTVLLAALLGGWKPGVAATVLSLLAAVYFFTRPYHTFWVSSPTDRVTLFAFFASGVAISLLCEGLHLASARIQQRQELLEQEIAERRRAELSEQDRSEQLRVTLASIGDAVITTDAHGLVTYLNGVAESLTGWKLSEARSESIDTVFRIVNEKTRARVDNPVKKVLREGAIVGLANKTVLIARNGVEWPIDDSAAPIRQKDGTVVGVVMIFRDVTERRRAEHVLKEADKRKDEFLATLAHELRNPLAPIRNALEVIRVAGDNQQVVHQARGTMERQLGQLIRLVDDLLDVSRITRGTIELRKEHVNVASIVQSAVETSQPLFDQVGQRLCVSLPDEPVFIEADALRMSQVFSNLLNNAAKYTQPGGRIKLTVTADGTHAAISVKDNGIGIPASMLDGIFDMFAQVDRSLERAHGGLGIGLTIVKSLVEMHGGTVEVQSDGHGRGSEFIVRQPIARPPAAAAKPPESDHTFATLPRRRILIVDDNKDTATSLALLLKLLGHESEIAHEGQEALDLAARYQPEIVLLDIGMPKMSGYEVCRHLRNQPGGKEMLIVAVTGWGQEEDKRKSAEAEFNGHMVKPVEPQALLKLLADLNGAKSSSVPPSPHILPLNVPDGEGLSTERDVNSPQI
jgi:PAS domain S-box-containing protein